MLPLFLQSLLTALVALDGHSWKRVGGTGKSLGEGWVNPAVTDAPGVSRWKALGNFQMWIYQGKADAGPGTRSININKT